LSGRRLRDQDHERQHKQKRSGQIGKRRRTRGCVAQYQRWCGV